MSILDALERQVQFEPSPFVAPIMGSTRWVQVIQRDGAGKPVVCRYTIPRSWPFVTGWYRFYPPRSTTGILQDVDEPGFIFVMEYLGRLREVRVVAVRPLPVDELGGMEEWLVVPYQPLAAQRNGWPGQVCNPRRLILCRNRVQPFDLIVAREGGDLIYERHSTILAHGGAHRTLTKSLVDGLLVDDLYIARPSLRTAYRMVYDWQEQVRIEAEATRLAEAEAARQARLLQQQAELGGEIERRLDLVGAQLVNWRERHRLRRIDSVVVTLPASSQSKSPGPTTTTRTRPGSAAICSLNRPGSVWPAPTGSTTWQPPCSTSRRLAAGVYTIYQKKAISSKKRRNRLGKRE